MILELKITKKRTSLIKGVFGSTFVLKKATLNSRLLAAVQTKNMGYVGDAKAEK